MEKSDEKPSIYECLGGEVPSAEVVPDDGDQLGDEVRHQGRHQEVGHEEVGEAEDEDLEDGERELVAVQKDRVEGVTVVCVEYCLLRGEALLELNVEDGLQDHLVAHVVVQVPEGVLQEPGEEGVHGGVGGHHVLQDGPSDGSAGLAGLTGGEDDLVDIYPGLSLVELLHYCPLIGRELHSVATPALLCHKEPARASKAPY